MKPFLRLKSVNEVEKIIFDLPMLSTVSTPLGQASGRRLAQPFHAPADLPGFARATMDGYAVKARDVFGACETSAALLNLAPSCKIGKMPDFTLQAGYAAPILTGSPLPPGADAVVMIEHTRPAADGQIEVIRSVTPLENIVEKDEDAARGQVIIPGGRLLRAQEIGILAAFGISSIETVRPCKVAIISTGDEITDIADEPLPGQIRDVNSWTLSTLCQTHGSEVQTLGIVGDNPGLLAAKLLQAAEWADVIVISGGSSQGMRDYTIEAFKSLPDAEILVHGVAISPGKPFILARARNLALLGLPGHVSSALICARIFLAPLLDHLQGQPEPEPKPWIEAILSRSVASHQGRRDYIRCKLKKTENGYQAVPLPSSSAVISGLVDADGLVICPDNAEGLAAGEKVRLYPI